MFQFRLAQRAKARAADRIILTNNKPDKNNQRKPVIIGYGTRRVMEEAIKANLLFLLRVCIVHYYKPLNDIVSKVVY